MNMFDFAVYDKLISLKVPNLNCKLEVNYSCLCLIAVVSLFAIPAVQKTSCEFAVLQAKVHCSSKN